MRRSDGRPSWSITRSPLTTHVRLCTRWPRHWFNGWSRHRAPEQSPSPLAPFGRPPSPLGLRGTTAQAPSNLRLVPARLAQRRARLEEGLQLVIVHGQRRTDRHVHVQVLVGAQAAAEEHLVVLGLRGRELAVNLQLLAVLRGVDRVVRLVVILREAGVLLDDDRLALRVLILALRVEVTELVDAGVRDVRVV